jgi:hypothetical protein
MLQEHLMEEDGVAVGAILRVMEVDSTSHLHQAVTTNISNMEVVKTTPVVLRSTTAKLSPVPSLKVDTTAILLNPLTITEDKTITVILGGLDKTFNDDDRKHSYRIPLHNSCKDALNRTPVCTVYNRVKM